MKSAKNVPKTRTHRVTFVHIEFLVTKNSFVYFEFVQFECRILRGIAVKAFFSIPDPRYVPSNKAKFKSTRKLVVKAKYKL